MITLLDTATVDYGDINLSPLKDLGPLTLYPLSSPHQIYSRVKNSTIVITNKCELRASLLKRLPKLRAIALASTGTNAVDLKAAKKYRIRVMNVPAYSTDSVVEHTFACILAWAKSLIDYNEASHSGLWSQSKHFTLGHLPNHELHGKTLGILGYGAIGQKVLKIAKALGLKVLIGQIPGKKYPTQPKRVSFKKLLTQSDILCIHTPLSEITKNLFNQQALQQMKKGAFLVNMSRGGIVEEKALAHLLKTGHLGGAALDVLSTEPPPKKHPLFYAPNLILTPHMAWGTQEARQRLVQEIAKNIRAFQNGKKRNVIV